MAQVKACFMAHLQLANLLHEAIKEETGRGLGRKAPSVGRDPSPVQHTGEGSVVVLNR